MNTETPVLPRIEIAGRHFRDIADEAASALIAGNARKTRLFQKAGRVFVRHLVQWEGNPPDGFVYENATIAHWQNVLSRAANFYRNGRPTDPDGALLSLICEEVKERCALPSVPDDAELPLPAGAASVNYDADDEEAQL